AIAKEAYVYGFPLVDNYCVEYAYFVNRDDPEYKGGVVLAQARGARREVEAAAAAEGEVTPGGTPTMKARHKLVTLAVLAAVAAALAQPAGGPVPVTVENFRRAETDTYFASTVKRAGGTGKFDHHREVMPIDKQTVIRANRDTLYSTAVFDLDAGPVTI